MPSNRSRRQRRVRRTEQGHVLLLMMSLLSAGTVIGLAPLVKLTFSPDANRAMEQRASLHSARQALLVYATVYPLLYGPRGAGPGHLPCPDTGGAEGPDPPCGRASMAAAALPRHVSLPSLRYALIQQPDEALGYEVDARFINNPVNRVVNDGVLNQMGANAAPVVQLSLVPALEHGIDVGVDATTGTVNPAISRSGVFLYAPALRPGVIAMVMAWVGDRLQTNESLSCPTVVATDLRLLLAVSDDLTSGLNDGTTNDLVDSMQPGCLDQTSLEAVVPLLQIEGVPASSHWFVRNQWHQRIAISDAGVVHWP